MAGSESIMYRPLRPEEVPELATLFSESFADNAVNNHIFQYDSATHPLEHCSSMKWIYEKRLSIIIYYDYPAYVAVNVATGAIVGAACCIMKSTKPGIWGLIRAGLLTWPFYWGVQSALRAVSIDEEFDSLEKKLYPNCEAQLQMVAVSPACQGMGIGKGIVRALLADSRLSGLAISLSTQKPQNVPFYRSLGFQNEVEHTFFGFKSWTMFKPSHT